jgi:hypothetical protein
MCKNPRPAASALKYPAALDNLAIVTVPTALVSVFASSRFQMYFWCVIGGSLSIKYLAIDRKLAYV